MVQDSIKGLLIAAMMVFTIVVGLLIIFPGITQPLYPNETEHHASVYGNVKKATCPICGKSDKLQPASGDYEEYNYEGKQHYKTTSIVLVCGHDGAVIKINTDDLMTECPPIEPTKDNFNITG